MEISEPSILRKLPRPQTENGRIRLSPVYSLTHGVKRKRQEICAASDGDSLNIYEVRNGKNLSSCPIPPNTTLLCTPCALQSKSVEGNKQRQIYYAAQRQNEVTISSFQDISDGPVRRSSTKSIVPKAESPSIIALDVLPEPDSHCVVAVHADGCFEIYAEGLSTLVSHGQLSGVAQGEALITATWLTPIQASKSVLKARPDLVATAGSRSSFIFGVSAGAGSKKGTEISNVDLSVWPIPDLTSHSTANPHLEAILRHKLSLFSPLLEADRATIDFNLNDTKLMISTKVGTQIFELTLVIPQSIPQVSQLASHTSSILITDRLLLSSTSDDIQLYNLNFRTTQNKYELNKPNLKRKRGNTSNNLISLIAYFPSLNRVIGVRRDQLVAIDVQVIGASTLSTATKQTSLLINNVGRGASSHGNVKVLDQVGQTSIGQISDNSSVIENWHAATKELEVCLQQNDFENFERLFLDSTLSKTGRLLKESSLVVNDKIDYLISKLFELETIDNEQSTVIVQRLKLAFPAQKVLEMLAVEGYLTRERLNRITGSSTKSNIELINYGDIPRVLADADVSLSLLDKYLKKAPYLAYQEVCCTVLLLLRQALAESNNVFPVLTQMSVSDLPTDRMSANAELLISGSQGAISIAISNCLCTAIERLGGVRQSDVSESMRKEFSREEVIALVQFLRQQLFQGGYTRSLQVRLYPSPPPSENGSTDESRLANGGRRNITLDVIAAVLASCVDAMGPVGVLSLGDEEEFVHSLIPELSSEISRATEALQDATFLEGVLRETIRFIESTKRVQSEHMIADRGSDNQTGGRGAITTLYSETLFDEDYDARPAALPLSLRAEGKLSTTKIRKGNGKVLKRSEREMGMHQDRLRGPYALERLAL